MGEFTQFYNFQKVYLIRYEKSLDSGNYIVDNQRRSAEQLMGKSLSKLLGRKIDNDIVHALKSGISLYETDSNIPILSLFKLLNDIRIKYQLIITDNHIKMHINFDFLKKCLLLIISRIPRSSALG